MNKNTKFKSTDVERTERYNRERTTAEQLAHLNEWREIWGI